MASENPITIDTDTGSIQGYISQQIESKTAVLLLHPHPKLGGDLNNNVVQYLQLQLQKNNYTTLRINTRGVGKSTGSSTWTGVAEREDVLSAVEYLSQLTNEAGEPMITSVFLAVYSFGAAVGCSIADGHDLIKGYFAISYPYGYMSWFIFRRHYSLANNSKPKCFVIGSKDNFTSTRSITSFVEKLDEPKSLHIVDDVDHFWYGKEELIFPFLLEFIKTNSGLKQ